MNTPNAFTHGRSPARLVRRTLPLALALLMPCLAWGATWRTVANNGAFMPSATCTPASASPASPSCRVFNSFNQPSVNTRGLVVFRARSKGGSGLGEPLQGVYTRNMALTSDPIVRIIDRDTLVPQPNNRGVTFQEPPAFPRIDQTSSSLVTRGTHQPVWQVLDQAGEVVEQVGTNGVYALPFDHVLTGESRLGSVPVFSYFQVPESPGTPFDIVPGAPAITHHDLIVFKGNYTAGTTSKTGVYYRQLMRAPFPLSDGSSLRPGSGTLPVVLIANTDSYIPGTSIRFGSTAPPSAAGTSAVFVGLDNEDQPTAGGIYLAPLGPTQPTLRTLVRIGGAVPGEGSARFSLLGEGLSFDGRYVAFWGAWGSETQSLTLTCPEDGNADLLAYCRQQYPSGHTVQIPVHQGMFVHDVTLGRTWRVGKTADRFSTFLYWNFSGHVPGSSTEDDGEPARWRSAAFVTVSRPVNRNGVFLPVFNVVFKARSGTLQNGAYVDPVDGIYLKKSPTLYLLRTLVTTGSPGTSLDPRAVDTTTGAALPVTSLGIEREGLRGNQLVIAASMATEEAGWAGIYLTNVSQ